MAKRGRKRKLTKQLIERVSLYKDKGLTEKSLYHNLDVPKSTWYRWKSKGEKAKSGTYRDFWDALEALDAAVEEIITEATIEEVKKGNVRAIELAMKRHPRLRKTFKEEPLKTISDITLEDRNKDVINERIARYIAELRSSGHTILQDDSDESLDSDNPAP